MSGLKITQLGNESLIDSNDLLTFVDTSDTTYSPSGTNKKILFSDLLGNIPYLESGDSISQLNNDVGYLTTHPTITAASSSDNAGRTYIQDILLDNNGHVTGITTATETVVDTNTTYTAGTGLVLNGTVFNIDSNVMVSGDNISKLNNDAGYLTSVGNVQPSSILITNLVNSSGNGFVIQSGNQFFRGGLVGGTGVTITNHSGVNPIISIGQNVAINASVTFNSVTTTNTSSAFIADAPALNIGGNYVIKNNLAAGGWARGYYVFNSGSTALGGFATFGSAQNLTLLSLGISTTPWTTYGIGVNNANQVYVPNSISIGGGSFSTATNGTLGLGTPAVNIIGIKNWPALSGGTSQQGMYCRPTFGTDCTSEASVFLTFPATTAGSYTTTTFRHYYAGNVDRGAGHTITNQIGFATNSFNQATNNYATYFTIQSGANNWNLYCLGTADNYLASNLLIGTTVKPSNNSAVLVLGESNNPTLNGNIGAIWHSGNSLYAKHSGDAAVDLLYKFNVTMTSMDFISDATNGPDRTTTNYYSFLDFDDSTQETAYSNTFVWTANKTVSAKLHYTMAATNSGNVVWAVALEAVTSGDALNILASSSFDTANSGTFTVPASSGYVGIATINLTNADSAAIGDSCRIRIHRAANNAADTATGDAKLFMVTLE